jgi:hypothetical protein
MGARMTKLLLAPGLSALALGLVAGLAPLAGCSEDAKETPAPVDAGPILCDDFVAGSYAGGTNLTDPQEDGGDSPAKGAFIAFAFAANDLTAIVAEHTSKIEATCKDIALTVDADVNDPAVVGKTGIQAAAGWCELAAYKLDQSAAFATGRPIALEDEPSPVACEPSAAAKTACATSCGELADCKAYCDVTAVARAACKADHVLVKLPPGTTPSAALITTVRVMSKSLAEASNFKAVRVNAEGTVALGQQLITQLTPAKDAPVTKQQVCYTKIAAAADAGTKDLQTLVDAVTKLEAAITKK